MHEHPYAATLSAIKSLHVQWSEEAELTSDAAHAAVLYRRLLELADTVARLFVYEQFHLEQASNTIPPQQLVLITGTEPGAGNPVRDETGSVPAGAAS
ncbi:hypothetical protein [Saccharopolyspora sp. ASAGF58]|uniref:hypothetical protein n=1 Tax=Saccharopolyspora sp. ASAGF58 TaxID=2719023 RepID=UPI00144025FB|nr:hypothetical protein [Saccharopolyspora sp. ASAGF58]QIZ35610.1 hypothetical protein FDZ84_14075 [Saccharopolyspora sp. ASAGF58]